MSEHQFSVFYPSMLRLNDEVRQGNLPVPEHDYCFMCYDGGVFYFLSPNEADSVFEYAYEKFQKKYKTLWEMLDEELINYGYSR
jgi:hypothetical protein